MSFMKTKVMQRAYFRVDIDPHFVHHLAQVKNTINYSTKKGEQN
jgi:hypothetical protein